MWINAATIEGKGGGNESSAEGEAEFAAESKWDAKGNRFSAESAAIFFAADNMQFEKHRGDDLQNQIQIAHGELEEILSKARQQQKKHLQEVKEWEEKFKIQERKYRRVVQEYK